jgi:hypothetical protein
MKALVYGVNAHLIAAIPPLLSRAGFTVDAISSHDRVKRIKAIHRFIKVDSHDKLVETVLCHSKQGFDLIVACDDHTLQLVCDSDLSNKDKASLLPVVNQTFFTHLCSKIGLSLLMQEHGILTPKFRVAANHGEMQQAAEAMGFPLLVKIDYSSGGNGVFEVASAQALTHLSIERYPVLLQEKIYGNNLEFSAFFQKGMPIFFDIAKPLCCRPNRFGPSVLRQYRMPSKDNIAIFEQIKSLGVALGADGFANICCIESRIDQKLYFIEADMRPTVWVEYSKYFDEDPAKKISRYFKHNESLSASHFSSEARPDLIFSYAPRLSFFEILFNRYHCRTHFQNYLRRRYLLSRASIKSTKFWLREQFQRHNPLKEQIPPLSEGRG